MNPGNWQKTKRQTNLKLLNKLKIQIHSFNILYGQAVQFQIVGSDDLTFV